MKGQVSTSDDGIVLVVLGFGCDVSAITSNITVYSKEKSGAMSFPQWYLHLYSFAAPSDLFNKL